MVCTIEVGLRVLSQVQLQNYRVLQFYIRKPAIQNIITVNILYTYISIYICVCEYTYMYTFTPDWNCEWTAAVTDWSESSRCKWRKARWLWMMFRIEWEFIAFETPPPFSWKGWGKLHICITTESVLSFCVCVSHNSPESKRSRKWDDFIIKD